MPTAPPVIFTPPSSGSAPAAPGGVFTPPTTGGADSFAFADSENPGRDGTYVYLGTDASGNAIWARDADTQALVAGVMTGGGLIFIQRDSGSPSYTWGLEDGTDWEISSPTVLMVTPDGEATRTVEANPLEVDAWMDVLLDAAPEAITFEWVNHLESPSAVFTAPSAGSPPSAPSAVFNAPSAGSPPSAPSAVFTAPSAGSPPSAPSAVFTAPSSGSPPSAPSAVFTAPSAGSPPADPSEIFTAPIDGGSPTAPPPIFGMPEYGLYNSNNAPLTNSDGSILSNSNS